MVYRYRGEEYLLNLIDTPGHVDFSYQVSRSIRACEGALLLVDATKGIQAQTLSNFYKAFDANLTIVPIINKIDLPAADIEGTRQSMIQQFDINENEILYISAKNGVNVESVLQTIIEKIQHPF
jgi:GTP-binding protein LepA